MTTTSTFHAENVFAVRLSQAQPQQTLPASWGGAPYDDGLRAMLSVRTIWAKLQTTVLFGDSLYMIWYDIGQLTRQDGFKAFLKPYFGHPITGAQLDRPPFASTPAVYSRLGYNNVAPTPPIPIATGTLTMLDAGFDAFRGYWIEFAGNYFLTFPIFKDWPNIIRETPNYKGFKPSDGGSGSSNNGGGSNTPPNLPPVTC